MCRLLFSRPDGKGGCLTPASNGLEVSLVSPNLSNSFESEKSFLRGFLGVVIFIAMRDGCHDLQGFVGKHQVPIEFFIVQLSRVDCKFLLPSNFSLPAVHYLRSQRPLQVLTPVLVHTHFFRVCGFL